MYLTVKSEEDAEEFQKDLDRLVEWEKTWNFTQINAKSSA